MLRANSQAATSDVMRQLDDIAALAAAPPWEEMVVMGLLAAGCIALLFAARRREERACQEELKAVQHLEQTNADLEAFAGRVAHDLRNPLVPILSGSQVIERSDVNAQVRRAAERIERSARRLSSMIDMLLDFSRLTARRGARPSATCAPIVEDVVDGFRDKARGLGVQMEIACDEVRAACEPIVLASPLQNLIENALKYGRRGDVAPVVEVRAYARGGMVLRRGRRSRPGHRRRARRSSCFAPSSAASTAARASGSGWRRRGGWSRRAAGRSACASGATAARSSRSACRRRRCSCRCDGMPHGDARIVGRTSTGDVRR